MTRSVVTELPSVREAVTRDPFIDDLCGPVRLAFLFCDLKDFTAYAEREGDGAALAAVTRLAAVVADERGDRCCFQKFLGDGVMLTYDDAEEAVAHGARIVAAMRALDGTPHVHASVHTGMAISHDGDYVGHTVNVAARLLRAAGPDELVATRPVVDSCGDRFRWNEPKAITVRGVRDPIEVCHLASDRR